MRFRFRFLKSISIVTAALLIAVGIPLYFLGTVQVVKSTIASGSIALVNVLAGCMALEYSFDKSSKIFMIAVFGGMGVRMALILVAFAILLLNGYDPASLSLSLMGFYVVFMIAELTYLVRDMNKRNAAMGRKTKYTPRRPRSGGRTSKDSYKATQQTNY